ncbi:MAG: hypothetical protein KDK54_19655 [Leptospiraceae bacterium]|nr:hypothetical protein [Leptospiraceae bacterium]
MSIVDDLQLLAEALEIMIARIEEYGINTAVQQDAFTEHVNDNNTSIQSLSNSIQSINTGFTDSINQVSTELSNAIQNTNENLVLYIDTRVNNLLSSPIDKSINELNGKRFFAYEFWYLISLSDIDGLDNKLNLFDTKLSTKLNSIIPGAGILIDNSDPQNPRIIGNTPPGYYNIQEINNNYFNKSDILNQYYNRISIDDQLNLLKSVYDTKLELLNTNISLSIIDNLTSTDTDKPLSANQGYILKGYIDTITSDNLTLSAMGTTSELILLTDAIV